MIRLTWQENKKGGNFTIIAEERAGAWAFFEKSTWEVRWYSVPSNSQLIAKANLMRLQNEKKTN
jgi:hypothetical protein